MEETGQHHAKCTTPNRESQAPTMMTRVDNTGGEKKRREEEKRREGRGGKEELNEKARNSGNTCECNIFSYPFLTLISE